MLTVVHNAVENFVTAWCQNCRMLDLSLGSPIKKPNLHTFLPIFKSLTSGCQFCDEVCNAGFCDDPSSMSVVLMGHCANYNGIFQCTGLFAVAALTMSIFIYGLEDVLVVTDVWYELEIQQTMQMKCAFERSSTPQWWLFVLHETKF